MTTDYNCHLCCISDGLPRHHRHHHHRRHLKSIFIYTNRHRYISNYKHTLTHTQTQMILHSDSKFFFFLSLSIFNTLIAQQLFFFLLLLLVNFFFPNLP